VPHNPSIALARQKTKARGDVVAPHLVAPQTDARLGHIIRVLMDYPSSVVSGTKLARELGTTRTEIWRLMEQLRELGVSIQGQASTGYRLKAVPDLLLPELLAPLVRGTIFGREIHHYYTVGSTNTAALEAAVKEAPEGSVFLAEQQTAGRGRAAHDWYSAPSEGIYCSVILRPPLPPSEALILSLAAGLAVHAAIQSRDPGLPLDLKWPNDVLIDEKKVCGILTEMNAEATRVHHLVVGIGINVNHTEFPEELEAEATSLRLETGREWSRVEMCASLLKSLDREYRALLDRPDARESVLRRFQERSSYARGRPVHVSENGEFEGVTYGLDSRGFLQVHTEQGIRTVFSGTVRPR
jgi:BirA family transcriptional regulator, biotin operon repressor / biotin---[acetyl-CoA-carboxylase] ligase